MAGRLAPPATGPSAPPPARESRAHLLEPHRAEPYRASGGLRRSACQWQPCNRLNAPESAGGFGVGVGRVGWCLGVGLVAVGVDDVDADRGLGHGSDHRAQSPGRAPRTTDHPPQIRGIDPHLQHLTTTQRPRNHRHTIRTIHNPAHQMLQRLGQHQPETPSTTSDPAS